MKRQIFTITLLATAMASSAALQSSTRNNVEKSASAAPSTGMSVVRNKEAPGLFCDALLIASDWVKTAAHCVKDEDIDNLEVVIGDFQRTQAETGSVVRRVKNIVIPASADNSSDIAFIELNSVVPGINAMPVPNVALLDAFSPSIRLTDNGLMGDYGSMQVLWLDTLHHINLPLVFEQISCPICDNTHLFTTKSLELWAG